MEIYFFTWKKNQTKILIVRRAKQNRLILVLNCAICGKKNLGSLKIKKLVDY